MTCGNCGSITATRSKIYYTEKVRIENCNDCPDKYVPRPIVGMFIKFPGGIKRTVAHDMDISRRRLAEDGRTVIKDYKRRSSVV